MCKDIIVLPCANFLRARFFSCCGKDFRKLLQQVGATVTSSEATGSGHVKVTLQAPDGRTAVQIFSATPSDQKGILNARARLRRFMDGREYEYESCPRVRH